MGQAKPLLLAPRFFPALRVEQATIPHTLNILILKLQPTCCSQVTKVGQANPSLLAPRFFPGFRLEQVLGAGGYGTAYQGKWHDTSVVLKVQDYQLKSKE